MMTFDPGAFRRKLVGKKVDFRTLAANLKMTAQELNSLLQGEVGPAPGFVEALAVALGCAAEELLLQPADNLPSYIVEDLKEALELLHNRGRLTWLRLAEWRVITNFLASNDSVFRLASAFWQTSTDGVFDVALLELLDMIHRNSLGIQFVLDTALHNKSSPDWGVAESTVQAWVAEDQAVLNQWRQKTQSARNYRNKKLAHYDREHLKSGSGLKDVDLGVIPSDVRDALYDCSKILNRYSSALNDTPVTWNTNDLHNFEIVARVLLLGQEKMSDLFSGKVDVETLDKNSREIERVDKRIKNPSHPRATLDEEHAWKWDWLERYTRDFRSGKWPITDGVP